MAQKLTSHIYPSDSLIQCPITQAEVKGNDGATFLIPDGQVTWWRCSACHGWHISIVDFMKK